MSSVGFAQDLRLCTRISMPSQLLQTQEKPRDARAVADAHRQFQALISAALNALSASRGGGGGSGAERKQEYDAAIAKMAQIFVENVRPNSPQDARALFALDAPAEPFATRSAITAQEYYAWLNPALLRAACEKTVDVARDSREPR